MRATVRMRLHQGFGKETRAEVEAFERRLLNQSGGVAVAESSDE